MGERPSIYRGLLHTSVHPLAMAHANNIIKIADGRITLYQRDDVKDGIWQCRITMKGVRGYIRRTTNTSDFDKAQMIAIKLLGELELRDKQNQPLQPKTFKAVAVAFLKDADTRRKEGKSSDGRYEIIKSTLTRYLAPYFGSRDITLIKKKDIIEYREWRMNYWITGPGAERKNIYHKVKPSSATQKQELTVLRGVFQFGVEMNYVSPMSMAMLKHEPYTVSKRPIFTGQEYRKLYLFMRSWAAAPKKQKTKNERQIIRNYTLIMVNSGMRKGEARYLKWRDVTLYKTEHGEWPVLTVKGKTGERMVVCQPFAKRIFERIKERGHDIEPDDYVFCHEDGKPILHMKTFDDMLAKAGLSYDSLGRKRTVYSLRHTYATFRLENGANVYWLKQNMGTSVQTIERHYGQTKVLHGIEFETARRRKAKKPPIHATTPDGGDTNSPP